MPPLPSEELVPKNTFTALEEAQRNEYLARVLGRTDSSKHPPADKPARSVSKSNATAAIDAELASKNPFSAETEAQRNEYLARVLGRTIKEVGACLHISQSVRTNGDKTRAQLSKLDEISTKQDLHTAMLEEVRTMLSHLMSKSDGGKAAAEANLKLVLKKTEIALKAAEKVAESARKNEAKNAEKMARKAESDKLEAGKKLSNMEQKLEAEKLKVKKLEESERLHKALIHQLKSGQKAPNTPVGEAPPSSVASAGVVRRRRRVAVPRGRR